MTPGEPAGLVESPVPGAFQIVRDHRAAIQIALHDVHVLRGVVKDPIHQLEAGSPA